MLVHKNTIVPSLSQALLGSAPFGAIEGIPITIGSPLPVVPAAYRQAVLEAYAGALTPERLLPRAQQYKCACPDVFAAMYPFKMDPTEDYDANTTENIQFGNLEDFRNVGRHCVAAALGLEVLGELAVRGGCLSACDLQDLVRGGLGHDLNKPREVNVRKIIAAEYSYLPEEDLQRLIAAEVYSAEGYESRLPERYQVAPRLMELFRGAGSQTGHLSNTDFIVTDDGGALLPMVRRTNFSGLMINLIDGMLYSTKGRYNKVMGVTVFDEPEIHVFMSAVDRMIAQKFEQIYPWMWSTGVAYTAEGKLVNGFELHADGRLSEPFVRHGEKFRVEYSQARWVGHFAGIQAELVSRAAGIFVQLGLDIDDALMTKIVATDADPRTSPDALLAQYLNGRISAVV